MRAGIPYASVPASLESFPMPPVRIASALFLGTLFLAASLFAAERRVDGNRTTENVPEIPAELTEMLDRYRNTRGAMFAGWVDAAGNAAQPAMLIATRLGETQQVHRVSRPLGMREQLTFHSEPVMAPYAAPAEDVNGFVYGLDVGGSEFWQLHFFDLDNRESERLTDGLRSRNERPLWSRDGQRLAYTSTARNGRDSDIWLHDLKSGRSEPVLTEGGTWVASDFSPDGSSLLVINYHSINDMRPGRLNLESGELTMFPVAGGKAGFGPFRYARDGRGVYYVSDEDFDGEPQEFRQLRFHDLSNDEITLLSEHIPWDVRGFTLSADGRYLAYVTNENGIDKLHVLTLPDHREIELPELPTGVVTVGEFSPGGSLLAVTLNTSTSPSDVYAIDLETRDLTRWTQSEIGGLDAGEFTSPELIQYPTFDESDARPREIPAFYYRPAGSGPFPVVVIIHGGPEGQARPGFNPTIQFLANEMNVAVLVPNVRGSAGYGKSYLLLDNGERREDSVKDIGALLDWVAERPELDESRVGVFGGSYGGYMVLASMVHFGDRLRAGVDVVGISSFVTFLENTEDYRRDLRRAEYGDESDPEMRAFLERISPLNNAHRIDKPLFVAQGANDPRVPASEAEQIVERVRANDNEVWYLLFADEGHGFRKKSNSDYFTAATMLFWQQHLLND